MINFILRIFASHAVVKLSKILLRRPEDWAFTVDERTHTLSNGTKLDAKLHFIIHKSEMFAVSLLSSNRGDMANIHIPNALSAVLGRIDNLLLTRAVKQYLSLPQGEAMETEEQAGTASQA